MKKRKHSMKKKVVLFIALIPIIFMSGKYLIEKYESKCIREYEAMHDWEFEFEVEDYYETKRDMYTAIINLAFCEAEYKEKIIEAYNIDRYPGELRIYFEGTTELETYLAKKKINYDRAYDALSESEERLKSQCENESKKYLKEIMKSSDKKVKIGLDDLFTEASNSMQSLAIIEKDRIDSCYESMFISCDTEMKRDIFDTLYHDMMVRGAVDIIKNSLDIHDSDEMKEAYNFLQEAGEYYKYAEEIAEAKEQKISRIKREKMQQSNNHYSYSQSNPYSVYDYSHPEDFYYDNYDDFYDYEEAEDYYNEYWDE